MYHHTQFLFCIFLLKTANFKVWCLNYVSVPEANLSIAEPVLGKRGPKEKHCNKGNISTVGNIPVTVMWYHLFIISEWIRGSLPVTAEGKGYENEHCQKTLLLKISPSLGWIQQSKSVPTKKMNYVVILNTVWEWRKYELQRETKRNGMMCSGWDGASRGNG